MRTDTDKQYIGDQFWLTRDSRCHTVFQAHSARVEGNDRRRQDAAAADGRARYRSAHRGRGTVLRYSPCSAPLRAFHMLLGLECRSRIQSPRLSHFSSWFKSFCTVLGAAARCVSAKAPAYPSIIAAGFCDIQHGGVKKKSCQKEMFSKVVVVVVW